MELDELLLEMERRREERRKQYRMVLRMLAYLLVALAAFTGTLMALLFLYGR